MNGRYVRLATRFWTDEKTINLEPETKLLHLYMLTSPHSNMAGYYRLPKAYIQADLQLSKEQLDKGFTKLLGIGLIKYCDKSSIVLIPNYYKYNPIQNKNQAIGAAKKTRELPSNSLVEDYKQSIIAYASKYEKELNKGLPKGLDKGFSERFGNTVTVTVTEKEVSNSSDSKTSPNPPDNDEPADEDNKPKFDCESLPYKAARYLRGKILENNKRAQVPKETPEGLEDWATEMDRLNRLGPIGAKENEDKGYSWDEIKAIINWCQEDEFWKGNILSAGKLREKVIQLENRMNKSSPNKSNVVNFGKKDMTPEEQEEFYHKRGYR